MLILKLQAIMKFFLFNLIINREHIIDLANFPKWATSYILDQDDLSKNVLFCNAKSRIKFNWKFVDLNYGSLNIINKILPQKCEKDKRKFKKR